MVIKDPIIARVSTVEPLLSLPTPELKEIAEVELITPPKPVVANLGVNDYVWGNCTFGVASWVKVPSTMGNANQWAYSASSLGYTISSEPIVGSVGVDESGYYGHVFLVTAVEGDTISIKEMNFQGLGITSYRTLPKHGYKFIYF